MNGMVQQIVHRLNICWLELGFEMGLWKQLLTIYDWVTYIYLDKITELQNVVNEITVQELALRVEIFYMYFLPKLVEGQGTQPWKFTSLSHVFYNSVRSTTCPLYFTSTSSKFYPENVLHFLEKVKINPTYTWEKINMLIWMEWCSKLWIDWIYADWN